VLVSAAVLNSISVQSGVVILEDLTVCGTRVVGLRDNTNATADFAVRVWQEKRVSPVFKVVRPVLAAKAYDLSITHTDGCIISVATDRGDTRTVLLRQAVWF
jgi:hypothetical protein